MQQAVRYARQNASDDDFQFLAGELVRSLVDVQPLALAFNPEDPDAFPCILSNGSRVDVGSGDRDHGFWNSNFCTHDIESVCGRSAWAIEHLFGLYLPAVRKSYPAEQLTYRQDIIRRYLFADWKQRLKIATLSRLPMAERIKLAKSYPNPRIPLLLAGDSSVEVRIAVCQSPWTPPRTYLKLRRELLRNRDLDDATRETVRRNCSLTSLVTHQEDTANLVSLYAMQIFPPYEPNVRERAPIEPPINEKWESELAIKNQKKKNSEYVRRIDAATTYDELHAAIEHVRSTIPEKDVRGLGLELINRVSITRKLKFNTNPRGKAAFPFVSSTIDDSLIDMQIASVVVVNHFPTRHVSSVTLQDIGFVGGRAAWALEELFGQCLPAIQLNRYSNEEIAERKAGIYRIVIETDWDRRRLVARLRQLSVDERCKIAYTNLNPRIQLTLARDPSREVRMAVRSNRNAVTGEAKWTAFAGTQGCTIEKLDEHLRKNAKYVTERRPRDAFHAFLTYFQWY